MHSSPVGPDVAQVDPLLALAGRDRIEQTYRNALREAGVLGAPLLAAGHHPPGVTGGRSPASLTAWRDDLAARPRTNPGHLDQLLGLEATRVRGIDVLVAALYRLGPQLGQLPPRPFGIALLGLGMLLGQEVTLAPGALVLALPLVAGRVVVQVERQVGGAARVDQALVDQRLEARLVAPILGATQRHVAGHGGGTRHLQATPAQGYLLLRVVHSRYRHRRQPILGAKQAGHELQHPHPKL